MKKAIFVWTCPACEKLVSTDLSAGDEAVLVCSGCSEPFGQGEETDRKPAEPLGTDQPAG